MGTVDGAPRAWLHGDPRIRPGDHEGPWGRAELPRSTLSTLACRKALTPSRLSVGQTLAQSPGRVGDSQLSQQQAP